MSSQESKNIATKTGDEEDYSDGELSLTESLQNMSNLPKNSSSPQPETPANTPTDQSYLARRMQMQEADKAKKANLIRSLVSKREEDEEGEGDGSEDEDSEDEDPLEQFTGVVRHRVEAVQSLQEKYDVLHSDFVKELQVLHDKYAALYGPIFERRSQLVMGESEPAVGDFKDEEDYTSSVKHAQEDEEASQRGQGIPGFWARVLSNVEELEDSIQERDTDALEFLKDIRVERKAGSKDFRLLFLFESNPFFTDDMLVREYEFVEDEEDPVMKNTTGCTIHWKPGKDLTTETKRVKKGGRTITKTKKVNSFFGFFSPPKLPQGDEDEEEDEDEEGGVHEQLEEDLELSLFIRDRIIPHATDYFLHNETTMDVDEFVKLMGLQMDGQGGIVGGADSEESDEEAPRQRKAAGKAGKGGKKAEASGEKKSGFHFEPPKEKCENQ